MNLCYTPVPALSPRFILTLCPSQTRWINASEKGASALGISPHTPPNTGQVVVTFFVVLPLQFFASSYLLDLLHVHIHPFYTNLCKLLSLRPPPRTPCIPWSGEGSGLYPTVSGIHPTFQDIYTTNGVERSHSIPGARRNKACVLRKISIH